jgi:hypothetical protein
MQHSSSSSSPQSRSGPQQQQQLTARALLDLCEQIYDSFNADQHTLDTHLHNSLQQQAARLTEDETCFVQEVGRWVRGRQCDSSLRPACATIVQQARSVLIVTSWQLGSCTSINLCSSAQGGKLSTDSNS